MSKIYEALNKANDDDGDDNREVRGAGSGDDGGVRGGQNIDAATIPPSLREVWEHYESLHSSMDKSLGGLLGRSVLFASSVEGEGATTVAAEYASSLGRGLGQGTLLVDANFRAPALQDVFSIPGDVGFADILAGEARVPDAAIPVGAEGLTVLPAGRVSSSPNALLTSSNIQSFLADARERYGVVLFDGPPFLPYGESVVLAGEMDGVVFVVESEKTKREIVMRARDALRTANANVLGVVLNRRRFVIPEFLYRQL